jgi:uncharacterized protein YndB with AHSA1/START domain
MTTKKRITIERTFDASIEDVWELWTTKEGIESWWGPEGFMVKVHTIDLRPGGGLAYAMICVGAEQIEFMKKANMPLSTEHRLSYTEIALHQRLAFTQKADFIPGVDPYDVGTKVEFHPSAQGVRMLLTIDAMHDEHWTHMAVMGWESELGKLAKVLKGATA